MFKRLSPKILIFSLNVILSLLFCFVIHPKIYGVPYSVVNDTDAWDKLGMGVWKNGTLSFYPATEPTIQRAPLYPALIAGLLCITNGVFWLESLQIIQSVLLGLTCLLVYYIGESHWNRRTGFFAALASAIYPGFIWFTRRVMLDSIAIFFFTLLAATLVALIRKPCLCRFLLTGFILGLCMLLKSTFLPYLVFLPVALLFTLPRGKRSGIVYIIIVAAACVAPWTGRNYHLTKKVIPVQSMTGYMVASGDDFIRDWSTFPFNALELTKASFRKSVSPRIRHIYNSDHPLSRKELASDSLLLAQSIEYYKHDPVFLLKKVAYNALLYWMLSVNLPMSIISALLTIPLLLLAGVSVWEKVRRGGFRSPDFLLLGMVFLYYSMHLPVLAAARYSIPVMPVVIVYACVGSFIIYRKLFPTGDSNKTPVI